MPRLMARVRPMDAEYPVEVRVVDGTESTAYTLTADQAALFLLQFQRVVGQVVADA